MTPVAEGCFGLFGTGGCARSIMPFVPGALAAAGEDPARLQIAFIDRQAGQAISGIPVLSEADFLARPGRRLFALGIAEPALRQRLAATTEAAGAVATTLIAPGVQVFASSHVGAGSVLCPGAIVTADARIGRHVHLNLMSYVEHDCRIGDFVTFAPGVKCNGAVEIGEAAYLGAGAMIRQGTAGRPMRIGARAVIGMGAVVLQDVRDGTTVAGNPARELLPREEGGNDAR